MSHLTIELLLARNQDWASHARRHDKGYFDRLKDRQSPQCLWIGCADSRVPAENLVQARPGELFVLRNVANQVLPDDDGVMSGIHYALTTLEVGMVVVCGHTGCGGVACASRMATGAPEAGEIPVPLQRQLRSLSDFLREQREVRPEWAQLQNAQYQQRMVELNVFQQLEYLQQIPLVQEAIRSRSLALYGCVYDLTQGELRLLSAAPSGVVS